LHAFFASSHTATFYIKPCHDALLHYQHDKLGQFKHFLHVIQNINDDTIWNA